ncbi:UNVERIFIED_CONTAM: hypothetical protein HHA_291590 [Hammondia hammondi]|eukprot:XP_008889255.1 hypothetical protein HHA_291590 [Hammondia hammondi]
MADDRGESSAASPALSPPVEELVSLNLDDLSRFWKSLEKEGLDTQRRCKRVDSQDLLLQFLHQIPPSSVSVPDEGASQAPLPPLLAAPAATQATCSAENEKNRQETRAHSPAKELRDCRDNDASSLHWVPGWLPLLQEAMGNTSSSASSSPSSPSSSPCRIEEASAALAAQHYQLAFSTVMVRDASWLHAAIEMIAEASSLLPEGLLGEAFEEDRRSRAATTDAQLSPKSRGEVSPKSRGEVSPKARGEVSPKGRGKGGQRNPGMEEEATEQEKIEALGRVVEANCLALMDDYFVNHFEARLKAENVSCPIPPLSLASSRATPASPPASSPSVVVKTGLSTLSANRTKRLFRATAHLYLLGSLCSSEHCVPISRSLFSHGSLLRALPPLLLLCAKKGGFLAAAVARALLHLAATGCGASTEEKQQQEGEKTENAEETPRDEKTRTSLEGHEEGRKSDANRKHLVELFGDTIITFLHLCLREQAVDPRGINALGFFFLAPAVPLVLQTKKLRDRIMANGEKGDRHKQLLGCYLEVLLKALTDPQFRLLATGNLQLARHVCEVVLELSASPEGCVLLQSNKLGWFLLWRTAKELWKTAWNKGEHAAWELIMTKSIRGSEPVSREEIGALCMWGTSSSEGGCAYCLRSDNTVRFLRLCQSPHAADAPLSPEAQAAAKQLKQLQEEMQRELEETEKCGSARRRRPPKTEAGAEHELDAARELRLALSPHLQRAQKELRKRRAARQRAAEAREHSREEAAAENQERTLRGERQDAVAVIWQRTCACLRERHREKEDARGTKKDEAPATDRDEEAKDASDEQESESTERKAAKETETRLELSPSLLCALACIGVHIPWMCRAVQLGCASGREETGGERLRGQEKHGRRGRDNRFKAGQKKHRVKEQINDGKAEAQTKGTRGETDEKEAASVPDVCRPRETVESLTPPQEETENEQAPENTVPSPASVSSLPTVASPAVASPAVSAPAEEASDASPEAMQACTVSGLRSACAGVSASEEKLAFSPCPACGFVAYCSEECRIKDLPLHLFICAGRN